MPKPVGHSQRYMPGLDGLRAIAVLAVIAYHLNPDWAPGGLLGVGLFFTLSGYLITDLLLGQREATGRLQLGDFWLRRARRLLPALFLMLAVVVAWVTLLDRSQLPSLRGDVLAAVAYVSNWWHRTRGPLRRPLRAATAARPLVVPGCSGSACVTSRGATGWPALPWLVRPSPPWPWPALPARPRPHAGLRGNRHPRLRSPPRCRPGHGVAEPQASRRVHHPSGPPLA